MKIAVYGKGNVGGGLADLWERNGHQLTRLGHDGGDVSQADVILIAVPGGKLADSLGKLKGMGGKTVIDATNLINMKPPAGFRSNAEFVKSKTNGPTAKSFNLNFAALYSKLGSAHSKPGNLWCGDEQARSAVEQLSRDAGYEPVSMGPLSNAALQESLIGAWFAIAQSGAGPFVYRIASPEKL
jgi:8-hydroxy-5-deazaflavin:NADPH oxidoreductase